MFRAAALLSTLSLLVTLTACAVTAPAPVVDPVRVPVPALAPCVAEDSPGPCYWDSATRGNGDGQSFTVDALGGVAYWPGE